MTKLLRVARERNARFAGRLPAAGEDSGSLMFALLLVFVGTALAAIMLPVLLTAMTGTRNTQQRTTSVAAAEAGIDVMMAQIRAASDSDGAGQLSELPCGSITNSVTSGMAPRYQVSVSYYKVDPKGHTDDSQASTDWQTANMIKCVVGGGAYSTPTYGLVISKGTDQASGTFTAANSREVQATYLFQSNNANISGGLFRVYQNPGNKSLCIDAGSSSPASGTNVSMQTCSAGSPRQMWAYTDKLWIQLVASVNTSQPNGMCLDAGTPETVGAIVQVRPCNNLLLPQQQWSFNNGANLEGTTDGSITNGRCFSVQTPNVVGSLIILRDGTDPSIGCGGGAGDYNDVRTWQPDASAGAGAAGASSGQLVNFLEFGRCLDVTETSVTFAYMIAWPCKQAPKAINVLWNQHWVLPAFAAKAVTATGAITTNPNNDGTLYCLKSPLSTSAGSYVTLSSASCPQNGTGTPPNSMKWTVYGKTATYSTSYQITDNSGNCLQPTDLTASPPDVYPNGLLISKIIVRPCNGSLLQKWNAPANLVSPLPLKDIGETATR